MMSLRSVARYAPRTLARLSTRAPATSSLAQSTFASLRHSTARAAFSTSLMRRNAAPAKNEVDEELSAKLQTEIEFENDSKDQDMHPSSIKDFIDSGLFEIEDVPGQQDVVLRRTYGDEKITITFSIGDLTAYDPDGFDNEADSALADSDMEGRSAEDGRSPDELDDLDSHDSDAGVPCRLSIVVEKPNGSALDIAATAQEGNLIIDNVFFHKDAALAYAKTADLAHKADGAYPGPAFGTLDEDLQVLMERYLEERGVTQALAIFVPDYMDAKEQREYLNWLNNVKGFVDA